MTTSDSVPSDHTVRRVRSPGELAALVPHLTGFVPEESLVALSLRGPRRRVGLTARVDLLDDPAVVQQVVDAMLSDGAAACVLVVFTAAPSRDGHPFAALVGSLTQALDARGVPVAESLLVRDGRWWSYRCELSCCPRAGSPLPLGSAVVEAVASEHVLAGRAVLASRAELVASIQPQLPLGAGPARLRQDGARADLARRRTVDLSAAREAELQAWGAMLAAWCERPVPPPVAEAAARAVALSDVHVRDTVLSWGLAEGPALLELVAQLTRQVVPPDDAQVCALLAWLAYAGGDGALALVAAERALGSDPRCTLARLLLSALDALVGPEQVREVLRTAVGALPGRAGR